MRFPSFSCARLPELRVGAGSLALVAPRLAEIGAGKVLWVASPSFLAGPAGAALAASLRAAGIDHERFPVRGEPGPSLVDEGAALAREGGFGAVLATGGGSALDAGKAVAAISMEEGQAKDYLEGVGTRQPSGRRLPLFCVPSTFGTGSEATRNAVLSAPGPGGFKKSLRHPAYVPDAAYLDPLATEGLPREAASWSALDALCQLLESYVSAKANPLTDAVAESGLGSFGPHFEAALDQGFPESRLALSYAAFCSGVALANAGLGAVHGLAGAAGARVAVPHGAACAALLLPVTRRVIASLRAAGDASALAKYARSGLLLSGEASLPRGGEIERGLDALFRVLEAWLIKYPPRPLSSWGLDPAAADAIAAEGGNKESPAALPASALADALREAIAGGPA